MRKNTIANRLAGLLFERGNRPTKVSVMVRELKSNISSVTGILSNKRYKDIIFVQHKRGVWKMHPVVYARMSSLIENGYGIDSITDLANVAHQASRFHPASDMVYTEVVDTPPNKECTRCGETKPVSNFTDDSINADAVFEKIDLQPITDTEWAEEVTKQVLLVKKLEEEVDVAHRLWDQAQTDLENAQETLASMRNKG